MFRFAISSLPLYGLLFLVVFGLKCFSVEFPFRTWTSTGGTQIEARLLSKSGDKLTIERSDSKQFLFPLSLLSDQDQAYVRNALSGQLQHPVIAKPMPKDFLNQYCTQCHGDEKQKADRRFDMLSQSIGDFREQELWQEIVDQLNLGEMPPDDEKQPSEEEKLAVVERITQGIAASREKFADKGSHTVLRRLNKFEYSNTVSDLLGLNTESWNPAADFPADVICLLYTSPSPRD